MSRDCWSTFCALNVNPELETVSSQKFIEELANNGLRRDDPRLVETFEKLADFEALHVDREIDLITFEKITHANIALIHKALTGQLQVGMGSVVGWDKAHDVIIASSVQYFPKPFV